MKVTKDTVIISGLELVGKSHTVQLKDADPNELQQFIDEMPASIKGKSVKYVFFYEKRNKIKLTVCT